ncbi:urophorphyrin methylase 1 [Artemisia annua]|uniref:uroporphyrinogen-III C-methyltransferase n=1 Tax=Artemisia annua TaxID=35608 RepID=A0A2U1P2C4_ARTAN|nr:urophorphyrin methylase 1 [Artemisia annua]
MKLGLLVAKVTEEIHELLLSFAEVGANVVRLKGGDPLVFGRGGEEMDFLQQKGIQVKVIPGITAASGIAAELGVPLTHRGVANSVRFLTGHSRKGGADPLFVAENAADPDSTLVVYMGLSTLPSLVLKLIQHGLPPDTPAAAVERGTTPQQRIVLAELKDLADKITLEEFVSPTLIFIGKVVALSPLWPQHCSQETECLIPHA